MRHAVFAALLIVSSLAGCLSVPDGGTDPASAADGCRPGSTDWLLRVAFHHDGWAFGPRMPYLKIVTVDGSVIAIQAELSSHGHGRVRIAENATIQGINASGIREALIDAGWYRLLWGYNVTYAAETTLSTERFQTLCERVTADSPDLDDEYRTFRYTHATTKVYEASTADGVHRTTVIGPLPDALRNITSPLPEQGEGLPLASAS